MEKVLLLRKWQCPLFPSALAFSSSFKRCWYQKQRLLSDKPNGEAISRNKEQGMYPGVPLTELVRGWFLYNLFRSNYLVDNGLKVSEVLYFLVSITASVGV